MAITKTRFLPKGTNVVAIIPAYNEAKYIKHTVKQLKKCQSSGLIQDIVVVSDGSTDKTAKIAKDAGAKVIELKKNKGKTIAFATAVRYYAEKLAPKGKFKTKKARLKKMDNTIVLSFDAELKEIKPAQIKQMIEPILRNPKINMVIGSVFNVPIELSGQRAVRLRSLGGLIKVTKNWKHFQEIGYGLETSLNYFIKNHKDVETKFDVLRGAYGGSGKNIATETVAAENLIRMRKSLARKLLQDKRMIKLNIQVQKQAEMKRELLKNIRKEERKKKAIIIRKMRSSLV